MECDVGGGVWRWKVEVEGGVAQPVDNRAARHAAQAHAISEAQVRQEGVADSGGALLVPLVGAGLVSLDVVARPVPLRLDRIVVDTQHVWREQRWLEVTVGYVVDARNVDVALGWPEDVLLAVLELADIVRVIEVVFDHQARWGGLEPLTQALNLQTQK